jgi:hypothetical protein
MFSKTFSKLWASRLSFSKTHVFFALYKKREIFPKSNKFHSEEIVTVARPQQGSGISFLEKRSGRCSLSEFIMKQRPLQRIQVIICRQSGGMRAASYRCNTANTILATETNRALMVHDARRKCASSRQQYED